MLAYFYEGNIRPDVEASFDPAQNTVRSWYHAPWQDVGTNGREPIHGLTRERVNLPGELDPNQTSQWNNYAVGFYNAPGGVTIGQVWADHGDPGRQQGELPRGHGGRQAAVHHRLGRPRSPTWPARRPGTPTSTPP